MPLNAVTVKIVLVVKMVLASVAAKSGRESGFSQCAMEYMSDKHMEYMSDKHMEYMAPQRQITFEMAPPAMRPSVSRYRLPKLRL